MSARATTSPLDAGAPPPAVLRIVTDAERAAPPPAVAAESLARELDEAIAAASPEPWSPAPRRGHTLLMTAVAGACFALGVGAHAVLAAPGEAPAPAALAPEADTAQGAPESAGEAEPRLPTRAKDHDGDEAASGATPLASYPRAPAPTGAANGSPAEDEGAATPDAETEPAAEADTGPAAPARRAGASARATTTRSVASLLQRGARLVEKGRFRSALPLFQRAATKAPHDADALYGLALAHAELGDRVRARRAATRAVAEAPDHGPALVLLGFLDQLARDVPRAKARYQDYLARDPSGPWAAELSAVLATVEQPLPAGRQRTRR